jgi:UDP-N-acetylglucosamine acyltransferase
VLDGLNVVGMRRRGFTRDDIRRLRNAYRALFLGPGVFRERLARVEREFAGDALVGIVLDFIRGGQDRPLMRAAIEGAPVGKGSADAASGSGS